MTRSTLTALVVCTGSAFALATEAAAFCPEPSYWRGISFETQVESYLEYLLCLHNGQVGTLNELSIQQNSLRSDVSTVSDRSNEAFTQLLQMYVELGTTSAELLARVEMLEERLQALEARVPD
jgi:hypothetical protein